MAESSNINHNNGVKEDQMTIQKEKDSSEGTLPDSKPLLFNTKVPAGLITPEFDIACLTVEELREEMNKRRLNAIGSKNQLCERLSEAIQNGETPPQRFTTPVVKKKRPHTRKEPVPEDFSSYEEFLNVWNRWREARDNNNKSVKRSRDAQRKRRQEHEANCKIREAENEKMEEELRAIKSRIQLLVNAVAKPSKISSEDAQEIRKILLEQHEKQTSKSQGSSQTEKSQKS